MDVELLLTGGDGKKVFRPAVEEGIQWTTERQGAPGKLTFKVVKEGTSGFGEGSAVRYSVDGKNLFFGFVFTKRRNKDGIIEVTAYDQLRYFQNKDTYVYEGKTASQFIRMLADDFALNVGTLEDTKYKIPSRVEDNTSLFDMVGNALDLTLQNSKEMYVLYDDFGKLMLKNISSMKAGGKDGYLVIDEHSAEDFDYQSSIDSDTYNKIKLTYDNEDTSKRDVYIAQDSGNINKWGILQYYDTLSKGENGKAKADALLSLYNKKTRNLTIKNVIGDLRVRAGSMVIVSMELGDITIQNFMLVEKAVHNFKLDEHFMDLTLRGGEFVA